MTHQNTPNQPQALPQKVGWRERLKDQPVAQLLTDTDPIYGVQNRTAKYALENFIASVEEEARREVVGKIGASLLAKHSHQAILDAYFDAANDILENNPVPHSNPTSL